MKNQPIKSPEQIHSEAKNAGQKLPYYWTYTLAPQIMKLSLHFRTLQIEIGEEMGNLIPAPTVQKYFNVFLADPSALPWNRITRTHAVTRKYVGRVLLDRLEALAAAPAFDPAALTRPMPEYLATLTYYMPYDYLGALCESLRYPHTLGNFRAHRIAEMTKATRTRMRKQQRAAVEAQYDGPNTEYLAKAEEGLRSRVEEDVAFLASAFVSLSPAAPSLLKLYAAHLKRTLPVTPQYRNLPLGGIMAFVEARLTDALPAPVLARLREEHRIFSA